MNTSRKLEPVFPLSRPIGQRAVLGAPRLPAGPKIATGLVLGHGAFMRAWSGRRTRLSLSRRTRLR